MRYLMCLLLFACLFTGCKSNKKRPFIQPEPTIENPANIAKWTLTVKPEDRHDEVQALIAKVVLAFHSEWTTVDIPVRFVATPGWRYCGDVWTVGCNPKPDLIELAPDYTVWVVAHDLFHVFSEALENKYHNNPYPRDPLHQSPQWPVWNAWRDKLIQKLGHR